MTTVVTSTARTPGIGRLLGAGAVGGSVAAIVNSVLLLIGKASGVRFMAPLGGPDMPAQAIGLTQVILFSLVPGIVAALLLALLGRFSRRPYRWFLIIAVVFLLLSWIPDWTLAMDSVETRLLLSSMHLITAASIIGALWHVRVE